MATFGKSAHLYVPKNGTSGARMKILRPLLLGHITLVHHFWVGFKAILNFGQMGPTKVLWGPRLHTFEFGNV